MRAELPLIVGVSLVCAFARADAVYLEGGRVLEGTAVVDGDKVTVELESGRMSFARSEVVRIDKGASPVDEADQREKRLAKDDVAGMLELANYCREHGLLGRERELLERVVARQPDQAEARRRLGYVREGDAWVLRSDQLRKERLAQRDSDLERKRMQLQLEEATLRRDRAEAALQAERKREVQPEPPATPPPTAYPFWYAPAIGGYGNHGGYHHGPAQQQLSQPTVTPPSAPPSSQVINGFRTPQSIFEEAHRPAHGHHPRH